MADVISLTKNLGGCRIRRLWCVCRGASIAAADLGFEHFLAADLAHDHAQAGRLDDVAAADGAPLQVADDPIADVPHAALRRIGRRIGGQIDAG